MPGARGWGTAAKDAPGSAEPSVDKETWVASAIREGRRGIYKKGVVKQIERLVKEYEIIFDLLQDDGSTVAPSAPATPPTRS